jgi:hypothetical protein
VWFVRGGEHTPERSLSTGLCFLIGVGLLVGQIYSSNPSHNQDYRDLCTCIGHLFITFARLEGVLAAQLKLHLAFRIQGEKAEHEDIILSSAIYGGMRFKAARDTVKRLMAAEGTPKLTENFVLKVFEHVAHIETFRDMIAHQQLVPAIEGPSFWQLTDAVTTKTIKAPKIYVFDADLVFLAAQDLVTAADRLGSHQSSKRLFSDQDFDTSPVQWVYMPSKLKLIPQNKMRSPLGRSPQE